MGADIDESIKEKAAEYRAEMIELAVGQDEDALMAYLEGEEPDAETLKKCIRTGTLSGAFVPVLTGTAFKNRGVQPLLDAVVDYMPAPDDVEAIKGTSLDGETAMERISSDEEPFSALAFKIMTDPFVGTLTFCRIYSGILNAATASTTPSRASASASAACSRCTPMIGPRSNQRSPATSSPWPASSR